jgi:Trk K+ transport system NAD-binding subunit
MRPAVRRRVNHRTGTAAQDTLIPVPPIIDFPAGGLPGQAGPPDDQQPPPGGHMIVCGDDALAHRLATELTRLYGCRVTVVLPSRARGHGPRLDALDRDPDQPITVIEAAEVDEAALRAAGVEHATALALTSDDDRANIHSALRARRINPDVRLVLRIFNPKLGSHVEDLLDRAALARTPGINRSALTASTTVLSASATAAPALVAAAVAGSSQVVHAEGVLLRTTERRAGAAPRPGSNPVVLALLPDRRAGSDPGPEGASGPELLLPSDDEVRTAGADRGALVLQTLTPPISRPNRVRELPAFPFRQLFPHRVKAGLLALAGLVVLFSLLSWLLTGASPAEAGYQALLDALGIADPANGEPVSRQVIQLLTALSGMLLMPLLLAVVLEALGTFRNASSLRRPPRGLSGHVVVLGLGKIGTRVLDRLCELDIPVVCVERNPQARGVALARSRRVPTVIGDATEEGVLDAARIQRARALLALTSNDSTNLETVLYARERAPELRVVLRLFDDDFADVVYRTLRDSYPHGLTRSRSVSYLAAPAFAAAMMGRQVLGAVPVGRRILLVAALQVADHPELLGRTVAAASRPGMRRIIALDPGGAGRQGDPPHTWSYASRSAELRWEPDPDHVLAEHDRVLVVTTREGLGSLVRSPGAPRP